MNFTDFARKDGVLRIISCPTPPDVNKTDGFIAVLDREVLLHDGGVTGCRDSWRILTKIREAVCPGERLHLTWVLSHFHGDHAMTAIESIIPDPAFAFDRVFIPPACPAPDGLPINGYDKIKPLFDEALSTYQPDAEIISLEFADRGGKPVDLRLSDAAIRLYPPDTNGYNPHQFNDILIGGYGEGNPADVKIPTAAINACCLWMLISYAGRRALFTGDSMKRTAEITDESFDNMLALWREDIGMSPDLMKWPHHGYKRNHAAPGVESMKPAYILTTHREQTADEAYREAFPDGKAVFLCSADRGVEFDITPGGGIIVSSFERLTDADL